MANIPWEYKDVNFVKSWEWDTPHFSTTVRSDGDRFFYFIIDKGQGLERSIASGDAITFGEAETLIKEVIGKTYPAELGYQSFTGSAGTSFRIYTGEVIDFQDFDGTLVAIEVVTKNNENTTLIGTLRLSGHDILLYPDTKTRAKIPPSFVVGISAAEGRTVQTNAATDAQKTALGNRSVSRTVPGRFIIGCTGADGFNMGTVSHSPKSPYCPIHKI